MKKFAKIAGQFVTDGSFNKIKITKNQALSIAKRQTKRLGLQDCKMQYRINENDQSYSIIVHTGEINKPKQNQTKQRQLIMKTFLFHVDFIDDFTGQFRTMAKEYRAKDYESAKKGINQYLETNKTIHSVLSCIFIKEI